MSSESVLHAVSHKLYLELSGNKINVVVADKYNRILQVFDHTYDSAASLEKYFQKEPELNAIYSSVSLVNSGCRFVSMPQSITEDSGKKAVYGLSYPIKPGRVMLEDHIGIQLQVYYEQHSDLIRIIKQHYPNVKTSHEVTMLHNAILPKLADVVNNVVARLTGDALVIMAFSQGKMIFCNYFETEGENDVFYFIMLTIEELEFDPVYTEIMILDDSSAGEETSERYGRYVKAISTPRYLFDEHSENRNTTDKISYALQAAVQCA